MQSMSAFLVTARAGLISSYFSRDDRDHTATTELSAT